MSKVHIEDYRGFGIYFDTENSTFLCDHTDYFELKTKKSYEAIKKYIDDFLKDNSEFKPFYVINDNVLSFDGSNETPVKIVGIRKDGRYVTEEKKQISEYDEKYYLLYRDSFEDKINEIKKLKKELREINTQYREKIKQIADSVISQTAKLSEKEKP